MNENELKKLIWQTPPLHTILEISAQLQLADCWLCAGSLRNFIWNHLSQRPAFDPAADVDIVCYEPQLSYEATAVRNAALREAHPEFNWELKNQAFMHLHNPHTAPYLSSRDAIQHFPERCTAIAARLRPTDGQLELFCPYGLTDLSQFIVAPTPYFANDPEKHAIYLQRVHQKNWPAQWPQITIQA